jgi:mannan endo-1,6-alpha-mannosidase
MAALSVIGTVLNRGDIAPKSLRTGATSESDPDAGNDAADDPTVIRKPITTADKAGAAILTILMVAMVVGGAIWMVL